MIRKLAVTAALALTTPAAYGQIGQPGLHFIENWDLDGNGAVTLEEAKTRRADVFYMFDTDENGVLDAEEYVRFDETRAADMAANAHGQGGMQQANAGMTLAFNDTDGNGEVTEAEFLDRVAAWFEMMDRSGDGLITTDDFGPGR